MSKVKRHYTTPRQKRYSCCIWQTNRQVLTRQKKTNFTFCSYNSKAWSKILIFIQIYLFKKTQKWQFWIFFFRKGQLKKVPGSSTVNIKYILFEEALQWWFPFEKSTNSVAFNKPLNDQMKIGIKCRNKTILWIIYQCIWISSVSIFDF